MTVALPTPHADKLKALVNNRKLPEPDRPKALEALERYNAWIKEVEKIDADGGNLVERLVVSLNKYRKWLDLDFIFDSSEDFLYRQKGQLKLDNSVLEEFIPWLVKGTFSEEIDSRGLILGPTKAFSQVTFDSSLIDRIKGGGMTIRSKDQDFAMALPLFLKASHSRDFRAAQEIETHLAYIAVEMKTNLDKTMFQEASATAYDLKLALPSSQYFLMCEWLDMRPISTAITDIKEVFVLRMAKRMSANNRSSFSTATGRQENRTRYEEFLNRNPFNPEPFRRFLSHIELALDSGEKVEENALERGWF